MAELLNIYDLQKKKTAVLQNAFSITEVQELNKIYSLDFSIPAEDEKTNYIQPFHYVRYGNNGQLYRIIKSELQSDNTSILKVSCEHVIATLCDDLLFGAIDTSDKTIKDLITQYGGGKIETSAVIKWLLSKQSVSNWVLDECDFDRKFEYLWEQENILNALYSIPKEFSKAYRWHFDTVAYPWKLSLKAIDDTINPEYYIRAKSNLLSSGSEQNYADICTRIYPLGYGEGVNQLTIKDATVTDIQKDSSGLAINASVSDTSTTKYNNTYIQSPDSIVNLYGIKERILVDRRYEDPNSLFSYAKTTLEGLQVPSMSRSFDVVDLYPLTNQNIDNAAPGKICKMTGDNTVAYITKTTRVLDDPGNLSIELSTKATDVASSIADLADRVRIESVYAQGATQLYQHSKDANAAPSKGKGMTLSLYFPAEMRQINKVLLKLELKKFRYYSSTTEMSQQTSQTTEGGSASGSTSQSTGGGGGGITATPSVTVTVENTGNANWVSTGGIGYFYTNKDGATGYTGSNGSHTHRIYGSTGYTTPDALNDYRHYHGIDSNSSGAYSNGDHTHSVTVNDHTHRIYTNTIQHNHPVHATASINVTNTQSGYSGFAHSHTFNIGAHTHSVTIPAHSHEITPNIYESSESPTKFDIYVGSKKVTTVNSTNYNGDITKWILNDKNQIPRDQWINIEVVPNTLAYVVSSVFVQGFVQSRGGGNY